MENDNLYNGFDPLFLASEETEHFINMPALSTLKLGDKLITDTFESGVIPYFNYSLILSKSRKLAYVTASNIDGSLFKKVPRKDSWRLDPRLKGAQWGYELYSTDNSKFDRGHLTKREDVQWGETVGLAFKAADSTFYYSNSVPQHKDLNRDVWRSLEDYILHAETTKRKLRITVFTGPVLLENDPYLRSPVNGESVRVPTFFWKIVYFVKDDGQLYRVGFLMSQISLLQNDEVVEELESDNSQEALFLEFKQAGTYQVNISTIEELAELSFESAIEPFKDIRPKELIFKEIDIDPDLESDSLEQALGFRIDNICL
ncbi:DNA/RNA non-specific endonuclease [Mucilaginibacter lappiensis]|uniref:Endonuclease G n=1 Tax=Mucilaginibacter lappiensis TaxID=354630 RepID=A0A841JJY6_9SPHI|nr:DNA/RNA non-specific endonuclease [Mucilaginibacter lappiensis]MBB6130592.1 endonuclease G [Mucilaginibacter lappiensis]